MKCRSCGGDAISSSYGPWCDPCGGVYFDKGKPYVRHVATAKGAGGEFKILFDHSLGSYVFSVQREVKVWVKVRNEFKQGVRTFTHNGTLDAMIAMAQPEARGDAHDLPQLLTGTGATPEEVATLDQGMPAVAEAPAEASVPVEALNIDGV